jgi:cyclic di-GMP phosphodiesterase Gmr
MNSSEPLRETLLSLRRENDRLRTEAAHAGFLLRAVEALLRLAPDDDPFTAVFEALASVFTFAQAMVLAHGGDGELECIAAAPAGLVGLRLTPHRFFNRVIDGRVAVTFSNAELEEWRGVPGHLVAPGRAALYLPIREHVRRGVLVLLQGEGGKGFDRADAELGRKFALLASLALAERDASRTAAERGRLRQLTMELSRSERSAQRNADLLNEVLGLLPVEVTVQQESGHFILVNDAAAAQMGQPAPALIGVSPADVLPPSEALQRRRRDLEVMRSGRAMITEETVATPDGERTLLTSLKPVRIFDESLLLSAALDITERKSAGQES